MSFLQDTLISANKINSQYGMVDSFNPSFRINITICYNKINSILIKHGTHIATIEVKSKGLCWQSKNLNGSNTIISKGQRYDHEGQEYNNQHVNHVDIFYGHAGRSPDNGLYR